VRGDEDPDRRKPTSTDRRSIFDEISTLAIVYCDKNETRRKLRTIVNRFGTSAILLVAIATAVIAGQAFFTSKSPRPVSKEPSSRQPANADNSNVDSRNADIQRANQVLLQAALPHQVTHGGFTGSTACRECHSEQYDSWHGSFHRTMTQVATPETVVAPFDRVRLRSRGRDYLFTREGDQFYCTMADPDWEAGAIANGVDIDRARPPSVKLRVVMSTGSHHMQSYWVSSNVQNMLRQIPWVYLIADKRWVPREDIFLAPPDSGRHFAVWNDNCLVCHAVAGAPKFDLVNIKVSTEVAELGISCEACHGPGQKHLDFHAPGVERLTSQDPVINPAKSAPRVSAEICGQCHAYFKPPDMETFSKTGYAYRAGDDLSKTHHMITPAELKLRPDEGERPFWSDGTCRVSGREYSSMVDSPCYQRGELSCISCHSMHSSQPDDQLAKGMLSNQACIQCHTDFENRIEAHTHHATGSSGSLCYNCHMPHTTFGLLKGIRSHRIQVPKVLSADKSDHPNACNLCHLDRTLEWSAEKLSEWYGQPKPDLSLDEREVAASLLWLLRGDAVQRAVTAWHMSWPPALEPSGDDWQSPFLAQLLTDDYSVVRYVAATAMKRFPTWKEGAYDYVGPPSTRESVKKQAIAAWTSTVAPRPIERAGPILLDAEKGSLRLDRILELLKQQNKQPTFLPE